MKISVTSSERTQLIDITGDINEAIRKSSISHGMCLLYVPHTTAAITINESADPDVKDDIETAMDKLVPWKAGYRHMEGNSAAHIKSSLIGASELIAIEDSRLVLGTWQGIFFCEFDGPRTRYVNITLFQGQKE